MLSARYVLFVALVGAVCATRQTNLVELEAEYSKVLRQATVMGRERELIALLGFDESEEESDSEAEQGLSTPPRNYHIPAAMNGVMDPKSALLISGLRADIGSKDPDEGLEENLSSYDPPKVSDVSENKRDYDSDIERPVVPPAAEQQQAQQNGQGAKQAPRQSQGTALPPLDNPSFVEKIRVPLVRNRADRSSVRMSIKDIESKMVRNKLRGCILHILPPG